MIVSGAIETVCEADTSIAPFEMNGTLYIPKEAFAEILGYGESKIYYDATANIFYFYQFKLNDGLTEVVSQNWYYTVLGSYEARQSGYLKSLSAPVLATNGNIFVPVSIFAEAMGLSVTNLGGGAVRSARAPVRRFWDILINLRREKYEKSIGIAFERFNGFVACFGFLRGKFKGA